MPHATPGGRVWGQVILGEGMLVHISTEIDPGHPRVRVTITSCSCPFDEWWVTDLFDVDGIINGDRAAQVVERPIAACCLNIA